LTPKAIGVADRELLASLNNLTKLARLVKKYLKWRFCVVSLASLLRKGFGNIL
jgi:hypothetical protein